MPPTIQQLLPDNSGFGKFLATRKALISTSMKSFVSPRELDLMIWHRRSKCTMGAPPGAGRALFSRKVSLILALDKSTERAL